MTFGLYTIFIKPVIEMEGWGNVQLSDKATGFYLKSWREIYEILQKELKKGICVQGSEEYLTKGYQEKNWKQLAENWKLFFIFAAEIIL